MKLNPILWGIVDEVRGGVLKWQFFIACRLQHTNLTLFGITLVFATLKFQIGCVQKSYPQSKNRISDPNLSQLKPKPPNTDKNRRHSLSLSQELTIGGWNIEEKRRHGLVKMKAKGTIRLHTITSTNDINPYSSFIINNPPGQAL